MRSNHPGYEMFFIVLQALVTIFLLFHDWIPLGRLNNLDAIHRLDQNSRARMIFVTLLPTIPTAICLDGSLRYRAQPYPGWLTITLWVTYVTLLIGLLQAWWIPYLLRPDPKRAARYQVMFAGTHSFLPHRNGIAPDTLHTVFHLTVVATVVMLCLR